MGGLPSHDLAADHTLGVLHRYSSLTAFHKHNEGDHPDHDHDQQQDRRYGERSPSLGAYFVVKIGHRAGQSHNDAGENQQRHAVAHAALGDLFAQPHDEHAARSQGQHG